MAAEKSNMVSPGVHIFKNNRKTKMNKIDSKTKRNQSMLCFAAGLALILRGRHNNKKEKKKREQTRNHKDASSGSARFHQPRREDENTTKQNILCAVEVALDTNNGAIANKNGKE